jgi:hypothetical protein
MSRSRGVSAVEVMVAVMVAAAIAIPCLTLLFQERDTEQRARYEYEALLAARDAMYEARALIAIGATPASAEKKNPAKPLVQNPLTLLGTALEGGTGDVPNYEDEQKRFTVEVTIGNPSASVPRIRPAKVVARWLDPNVANSAGQAGRKSSVVLEFGVLRPPSVAP